MTGPSPARETWSLIKRIGTVTAVSADGKSVDVNTGDGTAPLPGVPLLASVTGVVVGSVVVVLLDVDSALVIGVPK